jgi:MPBQ/MSBQ methyltransferase
LAISELGTLVAVARRVTAPEMVSMSNGSGLELSETLAARVRDHLGAQYAGVMTPEATARHLADYVGLTEAAETLEMIRSDLDLLKEGPLLDIGCGYGSFVHLVRQLGYSAVGVEPEAFEVEVCTQRGRSRSAGFIRGAAEQLPIASEAFSIITMWNVLEHVRDFRRTLAEAARCTRPGGIIHLVCPNYMAFRLEAHYHVPWFPLLPRRLASSYLRWHGRNPSFFEQSVRYVTNWGVLNQLDKLDLALEPPEMERLANPSSCRSDRARRISSAISLLGLGPIARAGVKAMYWNPFKPSVVLRLRKTRRR